MHVSNRRFVKQIAKPLVAIAEQAFHPQPFQFRTGAGGEYAKHQHVSRFIRHRLGVEHAQVSQMPTVGGH